MTELTTKKRPDFITVLCVLSFVNAGYKIIEAIINMTTADSAEEVMRQVDTAMEEMPSETPSFVEGLMSGAMDASVAAAENAVSIGLLQIVAFGLSALGVFFMWNLKKKGFGIYLGGQVLSLIVPFIFLGASTLVLFSAGMATFFIALFTGLYAVNLKHME